MNPEILLNNVDTSKLITPVIMVFMPVVLNFFKHLTGKLPKWVLPILSPIAGAAVVALGVDPSLATEGAMAGFGAVGVHQAVNNGITKPLQAAKAKVKQ